jgi:hypothetical protein
MRRTVTTSETPETPHRVASFSLVRRRDARAAPDRAATRVAPRVRDASR